MPHRVAPFRDTCCRCEEFATASCARCAIPLCDAHKPPNDAHCPDCEADFYVTEERRLRRWASVKTLGVAAVTGGTTLITAPVLGWSAFLTLGAIALGVTMAAGTHFATHQPVSPDRRRRFLAEKNPKFQAIDAGHLEDEP